MEKRLKKLSLNKENLASLDSVQLSHLRGGDTGMTKTWDENGCHIDEVVVIANAPTPN